MMQKDITALILAEHAESKVSSLAHERLYLGDIDNINQANVELKDLFARLINQNSRFVLAELTLLAASGIKSEPWFSQLLNFGSSGIILDIRPIIGKDGDVDIYLISNSKDCALIKNTLKKYAGLNLDISVLFGKDIILEANIYVDKLAINAFGQGQVKKIFLNSDIFSKIQIEVKLDKECKSLSIQ